MLHIAHQKGHTKWLDLSWLYQLAETPTGIQQLTQIWRERETFPSQQLTGERLEGLQLVAAISQGLDKCFGHRWRCGF